MDVKQPIRHTLGTIWFPIHRVLNQWMGSHPPGAFRILAFHHVPQSQRQSFERLLKYLMEKHGILTPAQAASRLRKEELPNITDKVPYLLTFDDGFKGQATMIREVLDDHGVKALFFICPGLMDLPEEEQRRAIAGQIFDPPWPLASISDDMLLLSWAQAASLIDSGHTIGAHTLTHRPLSRLRDAEVSEEVINSGSIIDKRLGVAVEWFAYPFGDNHSIDARAFRVIAEHYQFCCSCFPGINYSETPPHRLLRRAINLETPFSFQKMVLQGGLDFFFKGRVKELFRL